MRLETRELSFKVVLVCMKMVETQFPLGCQVGMNILCGSTELGLLKSLSGY